MSLKRSLKRRAMVWGTATKKKRPGAMVWIVLRREALIWGLFERRVYSY